MLANLLRSAPYSQIDEGRPKSRVWLILSAVSILLVLAFFFSRQTSSLGKSTVLTGFKTPTASLASQPLVPNQCEDLLPPEGCAWRGSTHWASAVKDDFNIFQFQMEFGVPLHIYRSFKYPGGENVTTEERKFVEAGGILWYGFAQQDWTTEIKNLQVYGEAIRSLKPAKVMVCPGWEPDGHAEELGAEGHEQFGTIAEYRTFRENVKKVFDEMGVDNAVYIMDFSVKPSFTPDNLPMLADFFPTDGQVKWVFFNAFQTTSFSKYDYQVEIHKKPLPANPSSKEQIKVFYDYFDNNTGPWTGLPWGLGAWGTNAQDQSPQHLPIPTEDRETFLAEVQEIFSTGTTFPNMKAQIYFDSLYSLITPEQVLIEQKGDLAHNFAITQFPDSSELVPSFKAMNKAASFLESDGYFGQPLVSAAADFISGLPIEALYDVATIPDIMDSPFVLYHEKVKQAVEQAGPPSLDSNLENSVNSFSNDSSIITRDM